MIFIHLIVNSVLIHLSGTKLSIEGGWGLPDIKGEAMLLVSLRGKNQVWEKECQKGFLVIFISINEGIFWR